MKIINKENSNMFKLIISNNRGKLSIKKIGKVEIIDNTIRLKYGSIIDEIGWITPSELIIRTLHRNIIPFYIRCINDEIWISNNILELLIFNETISIKRSELLLATSGSDEFRTTFSNLFKDISILFPMSFYKFSFKDDKPSFNWFDIDFEFKKNINKEIFLNFLIDRYDHFYHNDNEICLAISGGYDSRLELAIVISRIKFLLVFQIHNSNTPLSYFLYFCQ
jgi:hypothetical protein